jgi:hypothetical protein
MWQVANGLDNADVEQAIAFWIQIKYKFSVCFSLKSKWPRLEYPFVNAYADKLFLLGNSVYDWQYQKMIHQRAKGFVKIMWIHPPPFIKSSDLFLRML